MLIEPLNPSDTNRIYLKDAPRETLDLLASAGLATCLYPLYRMLTPTPPYLKHFPDAFIRIQQDTTSSIFRLKYEIACKDEKNQTHVLKSEFSYFGNLPVLKQK